jgi:hypothetical protein
MRKIFLILPFTLIFLALIEFEALAFRNFSLEDPYSGLAGNSVTDIVYDGKNIWVATGDGLSRTSDGGNTWWSYDKNNGLNADEVSALAFSDSSLWVAVSYSKLYQGELWSYGVGFNATYDAGNSFHSLIPEQANFIAKLAYDIAIVDSTVWAACWAGGLIKTKDKGASWENVFTDSLAKVDYEQGSYQLLRNRFFSVVADTSPSKDQMVKNEISDIAFDGKYFWLGTPDGLKLSADSGKNWVKFDTTTIPTWQLNSNKIISLADKDSTLWVGTGYFRKIAEDSVLSGTGFNKIINRGQSVLSLRPSQASGDSMLPLDIFLVDSTVWAACLNGGLIRTKYEYYGEDTLIWENIFVDSLAEKDYKEGHYQLLRNRFFSVFVDTTKPDSMIVWSGTASGIYKFIYTNSDAFDTVINYNSFDNSLSGDLVASLNIQNYNGKKIIWAATQALHSGISGVSKSTDEGNSWTTCLLGEKAWSFAFRDSIVYAATNSGLKKSSDYGGSWEDVSIYDYEDGYRFILPEFRSILVSDNSIWAGSKDGAAYSFDSGGKWKVLKFFLSYKLAIWAGTAAGIYKFIFTEGDSANKVLGYSYYADSSTISGDFVVSLGLQNLKNKKIVWAGTQPAYEGSYGLSRSTDDGETWEIFLPGDKVWNFDFDDSVVWAATSSGLKRSRDYGKNWDVFTYMTDSVRSDQKVLSPEYLAVKVIKDTVWAGNADGLVKFNKNAPVDTLGGVFRSYVHIGTEKTPEAYAYPNPFSPEMTGPVRIHFKPKQDGEVTIKIYDFAMNLVTTVMDKETKEGRGEYDTFWDGKNDKGDLVANGVYFFKLEAKGQTEWGKVVVIK